MERSESRSAVEDMTATVHGASPTYLIRLTQTHETFRIPELLSLAQSLNVHLEISDYLPSSPFCVIRLQPKTRSNPSVQECHDLARTLAANSILTKAIYELYATASTYERLHDQVRALSPSTWTTYRDTSFKFSIDAFYGKRSTTEQRQIIESFNYLPFNGKIQMRKPDQEFVLSEEWDLVSTQQLEQEKTSCQNINSNTNHVAGQRQPRRVFFGRHLGASRRDLIDKHDLKKRLYISTTSMDAELALVTANLALAGPGKLFLDPFMGTGGFMVAAAELGAFVLGSDIDGRSFRGNGRGIEKGVGRNFTRYGLTDRFGDCLTADLTNSPLVWPGKVSGRQNRRWLDGIICDPPYGVREGLKVLGRRIQDTSTPDSESAGEQPKRPIHDGPYLVDGVPSHTLPGFIAPKRPYSFNRMLDDIVDFAAHTLVDDGRLAFWMPCANEATEETFPIPRHSLLELKHVCVQSFNKWSRRLLVYSRIGGDMLEVLDSISTLSVKAEAGVKADELNQFRRMYFQSFNTTSANGNSKHENG